MKNLIGFGIITKKLIIPFLLAFSQIIIDIEEQLYSKELVYCDEENKCKKISNALNAYSASIGSILVIIIPHIKAFSNENKQNIIKDNISRINMCCKYCLLIFLYLILISSITYSSLRSEKSEVISPHNYGLCMKEGFEIIFLTLITSFILKYKYFLHNLISLLLFIVVCLSIDLILERIQKEIGNAFQFILDNIINVIIELIFLIYEKYLIEKLYFSPWTICFVDGMIIFTLTSFATIIILIKGKNNSGFFSSLTEGFYDYFEKIKVSIIISQFIVLLIFKILYNIFISLTIYYFSINHILICYSLAKMANILIKHESKKEYYCIILFIVQFLLLMIYLEVIELHFCGLDKNTRKNIILREREEMNMENFEENNSRKGSYVEISPGYLISKEYNLNDSSSIKYEHKHKRGLKKVDKNMRLMSDLD